MQGLPEIGDVLDDTYEIESLIGTGGFGAVYLARQLSMDRQVALKVLVAQAPKAAQMTERFRREVHAVRNLQHPNTIRIYDFRDRPDGLLYYAMEFVRGPTLEDVIADEGPMSPRRVGHILRQVLKSLSEAHNFGIVHRDLKPANIMLAEMHGETDFVKVLDFGIAKIIDGDEEVRKKITNAGVLVGTLNYMAPEQIAGDPVGPPSDLYALGLIAIEMLTGASVFAGTGRWEILHRQISDEPVGIPDAVEASTLGSIIAQAMQKKLDRRYSTAEEMVAALDALAELSDEPLVDEVDDTVTQVLSDSELRPVTPSSVNATPIPDGTPIPDDPGDEATVVEDFEEAKTKVLDSNVLRSGGSGSGSSITIPPPGGEKQRTDESSLEAPTAPEVQALSLDDLEPVEVGDLEPETLEPETLERDALVTTPEEQPDATLDIEGDERPDPTLDIDDDEPATIPHGKSPEPDDAPAPTESGAVRTDPFPRVGAQTASEDPTAVGPHPQTLTTPTRRKDPTAGMPRQFPVPDTKSESPNRVLIAAGGFMLVVLLLAAAGVVYLTQRDHSGTTELGSETHVIDTTDRTDPTSKRDERATDERTADEQAPDEEAPDKQGKNDPTAAANPVRILTPGVVAEVFDGERRVGETPLSYRPDETTTLAFRADGYDEVTAEVGPESDELLEIEMNKKPKTPPDESTSDDASAAQKPDAPPDSDGDWIEPLPAKKPDGSNDEEQDDEDESEPEIPIF